MASCEPNTVSSACCNLGTKGCEVVHVREVLFCSECQFKKGESCTCDVEYKTDNVCSRSACSVAINWDSSATKYRIWNQSGKCPGYRDYCSACGRRIMALAANQTMRHQIISMKAIN